MSDAVETPKAGWRMKVAIFALCISIFVAIWMTVAALGTRFGWWHYQVGLLQMTAQIGGPLAFFALAFGVVSQIIALIKAPRKQAFIVALAATLIAASMAGRLMGFRDQAMSVPPIHDIQTNWSDPVEFTSAMLALRTQGGAENDASNLSPVVNPAFAPEPLGGSSFEDAQRTAIETEAYPQIGTLYFSQSPADVAALTEQIMRRKGWAIVSDASTATSTSEIVVVEATQTSGWFGFKDDVAVRAQSVDGTTVVDIRSMSRVGVSDLGANATRVYGLMVELEDRGNGRRAP